MKLWAETDPVSSAGRAVRIKVSEITSEVNRKVASRGVKAVNAIRNAEREVLKGERSGREYTKYPFKSKYRASAPGEPPAKRTGNLRMHWNGNVKTGSTSKGGIEVIAELESCEKYAAILEEGTNDGKIKPRPFRDKIREMAEPEIKKIYTEPYT